MAFETTTPTTDQTQVSENALTTGERVGCVSHVGGARAGVALHPDLTVPVQVGDLLTVLTGGSLFIGEVSTLALESSQTVAELSLLATVEIEQLSLTPGISHAPRAGSDVFRPSITLLKAYLEDRRSLFDELTHTLSFELGASPLCPSHPLSFSPERILGRHCAVVGTSGSGKSWTLARLIEQCCQHNGKAVVIDPSGEYSPLSGAVRHLHLGSAPSAHSSSTEVTIPYYQLTEADLVAIVRPTSATQITKLRAAIRSLKLLNLDPRLGVEGNLPKANRLKAPFEFAFSEYHDEVCRSDNAFNIHNLPMQIGLECVDPIRSHTESNYWGGVNVRDHNECVPLISRLEDLTQSTELDSILRPTEGGSLLDAIEAFLNDPSLAVLRVSCEYLPTINRVREIVSNALARHLLSLARAGRFRSAPLILAVDEAHQMLPTSHSALSNEYPLEAFNVIAKEGRKYGLTLCVATQRPRDIPDDVLSQIGTFIVHRLVSDADRSAIERASGAVSHALQTRLPSLSPGEAFLMGVDFLNPLRLRIERPCAAPISNGPNFQASWGAATFQ
jgi:hypothetical protein